MRYLSTRGAEGSGLVDAVMRGLAADGGLFVPDELPRFDRPRRARRVAGRDLGRGARAVLRGLGSRERARRHLPRCVRFPVAAEAALGPRRARGARAVSRPDGRVQGRRGALPRRAHGARAAPLDGCSAADDSRRDVGRHRRRRRRGVPSQRAAFASACCSPRGRCRRASNTSSRAGATTCARSRSTARSMPAKRS